MGDTLEIVKWLEQLSKVGFGVLASLLLFGNYSGIYVWGKFHRERIASLEASCSKVEIEKNEWKTMSLGRLRILEETQQNGKRGQT